MKTPDWSIESSDNSKCVISLVIHLLQPLLKGAVDLLEHA